MDDKNSNTSDNQVTNTADEINAIKKVNELNESKLDFLNGKMTSIDSSVNKLFELFSNPQVNNISKILNINKDHNTVHNQTVAVTTKNKTVVQPMESSSLSVSSSSHYNINQTTSDESIQPIEDNCNNWSVNVNRKRFSTSPDGTELKRKAIKRIPVTSNDPSENRFYALLVDEDDISDVNNEGKYPRLPAINHRPVPMVGLADRQVNVNIMSQSKNIQRNSSSNSINNNVANSNTKKNSHLPL